MKLLTIVVLVAGLTGVPAQPVEVLPKVADTPVHPSTDYITAGAGNWRFNNDFRGEFDREFMGPAPRISVKGKRAVPVIDITKPKTEDQTAAKNHFQDRHEAPADGSGDDPTFKNIETRGYNHYGGHGYGGGGYGGYGGGDHDADDYHGYGGGGGWGGGHGGYGGYGHGGGYGGYGGGGHGGYGGYGHGGGYGGYGHGGGYGGGGYGGHDYHAYNYVSSRASRGEHNTAADDQKYRDNIAKLEAGNCGEGCHHSLYSYQSVESKDAKLAAANNGNYCYDHHDDKK
ncbi:hypothetical protein LX32DRAFT_694682 [Colletotrichum zoysiae]|uniref:Uncharacterized protein n=1 Tax=Colletotrichum zoysiae TaxID=1216348 RepID=A0AAD9HEG6_9PEZI|nr:hypothetical protein LX32DRAFT_694682 [Colletotrichum zoysiae]